MTCCGTAVLVAVCTGVAFAVTYMIDPWGQRWGLLVLVLEPVLVPEMRPHAEAPNSAGLLGSPVVASTSAGVLGAGAQGSSRISLDSCSVGCMVGHNRGPNARTPNIVHTDLAGAFASVPLAAGVLLAGADTHWGQALDMGLAVDIVVDTAPGRVGEEVWMQLAGLGEAADSTL